MISDILIINNNNAYRESESKMTKTTSTVKAVKSGDWVLPITVNDKTVYALQINKSAEDKKNITDILAEYNKAGVTVYEYAGKNNNPVLLVKATDKIKATRSSVQADNLIAELVALGVSEDNARLAYSNAKAKAKAAKQ